MIGSPPPQFVFISYAHANGDFVRQLTTDLQGREIKVWIDKSGLKPGMLNWDQSIRDAISASFAVLLVASPDSRRSRYVLDELTIAEMEKRHIYPVWAFGEQFVDCVPMGMGKMQYIDARGANYENALSELVAVLADREPILPSVERVVDTEPDFKPRNPYKGLNAFTDKDSGDFFGRDDLIETLLQLLTEANEGTTRLLAVIGPSGSGKSSVIMAGVLPRLQSGALPSSEDWIYLEPIVPGSHPLESLAISLQKEFPGDSFKSIRDDLEDDRVRGLHLRARSLSSRQRSRVVLLVDQFEELFTQTINDDERRCFIDLLVTAVTEPNGPLIVILTLRADFYDRPMNYLALGQLIKVHNETVLPMSLTDLRDVIEKPATLDDVRLTFEDGLVSDLVFEVRGQVGALPLLEFTLDQMYERREGRNLSLKAYHEIGGVRGALAKHAEATYQALPSDAHRRLAGALFRRLIDPGLTEQDTTRRRAAMSELVLHNTDETRILRETADLFIAARLLTTSEIAGKKTIEVSHEALIREWARLTGWLIEARDDIQFHKEISADAVEWLRHGNPTDRLYRGVLLDEARAWAVRNMPSVDEIAFIVAGNVHEKKLASVEIARKAQEVKIARRAQNFGRAAVALSLVGVLAGIATVVAISQVGDAYTQVASIKQQQVEVIKQAGQTSTSIAQTSAPVQSTLQAGSTQIAAANAQVTSVLQEIETGKALNESLRLAAAASGILQTSAGNAETAALLGIRALKTAFSSQANAVLVRAMSRIYVRQMFVGHTGEVKSVVFSPDGKYVLTGSQSMTGVSSQGETGSKNLDNTLRLWDVETGNELRRFSGYSGDVNSIAFSPDGKYVLTGSSDRTARLWDVETGNELRRFSGHNNGVNSVAFSPDGKYVLTGSSDKTARLWDVETGNELHQFVNHSAQIQTVTYAPDGKMVATGSDDYTIRLWDTTGKQLSVLSGHVSAILSLTFSGDSKQVLSSSEDRTIRLWDTTTGKQLSTFSGHAANVGSVAFSPDDKWIVTGSGDSTARLWDIKTGKELRAFIGHGASVNSVAFSPDGKWIVTGSGDGTARLWESNTIVTGSEEKISDMEYHALIASACTRVFHDFTNDERQQFGINDKEPTCPKLLQSTMTIVPTDTPIVSPTPSNVPSQTATPTPHRP